MNVVVSTLCSYKSKHVNDVVFSFMLHNKHSSEEVYHEHSWYCTYYDKKREKQHCLEISSIIDV